MSQVSSQKQEVEQFPELALGEQCLVYNDPLNCALQYLPEQAFQHLLIVTFRTPSAVRESLERLDVEMDGIGIVPLSASDVASVESPCQTKAVNPSDPTALSVAYTEALECLPDGDGWVICERMALLEMYLDDGLVKRLIKHLTDRAAANGYRGIYELGLNSASAETIQTFEDTTDRSVDTSAVGLI